MLIGPGANNNLRGKASFLKDRPSSLSSIEFGFLVLVIISNILALIRYIVLIVSKLSEYKLYKKEKISFLGSQLIVLIGNSIMPILYIRFLLKDFLTQEVASSDPLFDSIFIFMITDLSLILIPCVLYYKKVINIELNFQCYRIRSYLFFGFNFLINFALALIVLKYYLVESICMFFAMSLFVIEMLSYFIGLLLIPFIHGKDSFLNRISYMKKIFKNEHRPTEVNLLLNSTDF